MQRSEVLEKIKEIVCETIEADPADIDEQTTFDMLGADSFDRLEMITAFENEFDITIDDADLENLTCVADVIDAVLRA